MVPLSATTVAFMMRFQRFFVVPLRTSRNVPRVREDGLYESTIAHEDKEEKNIVDNEYGNGGSGTTRDQRIIGWIEQIVNYKNIVSDVILCRVAGQLLTADTPGDNP